MTIVLCVIGIIIGGIYGLIWCDVIGTWAVFFINGYLVSKHIGYSLANQVKDILPSTLLSAIIGVVVFFVTIKLQLNMYIVAIIQMILIGSLYLLFSYLLKIETISFVTKLVKERLSKK